MTPEARAAFDLVNSAQASAVLAIGKLGIALADLRDILNAETQPPEEPPVDPEPPTEPEPPVIIGDRPTVTAIVKAGSTAKQVQAALDAARDGDVLLFETGNYDGELKVRTPRLTLMGTPGKTVFRKTGTGQFGALDVLASGVTLRDFSVGAMPGLKAQSLVTVGNIAATALSDLPTAVALYNLTIFGDPNVGARRGIQFAAGKGSVIDSCRISACFDTADAQGIWSHIGEGWTIRNCDVMAAAQGIMLGGSPSQIPGHTITDVLITGCKFHQPGSWPKTSAVKYLVELKRGRNIRIIGNQLYDMKGGINGGCAIGITERTEGGRNPWTVIEDVVVESNLMWNVGRLLNTIGRDDNSKPTPYMGSFKRLTLRNNLCICTTQGMYLMTGVENALIENNTVVKVGLGNLRNSVYLDSPPMGVGATKPSAATFKADYPMTGLVMRRNILGGVFIGRGTSNDAALRAFAPDADATDNLFSAAGPTGNQTVKLSDVIEPGTYTSKRPGYGSTLEKG